MESKHMENKFDIRPALNPYLLQFNYALVNWNKFVAEERLEKRKRRHRFPAKSI